MPEDFDVVVIGGGTAGLVTASGCVRLGRRVAMIEREALGGDCLWTGCVPTKALVASAKLAHQMRHAEKYGLQNVEPLISPRAIMDSMRSVRADISRHDAPKKFRDLGIDVIEGQARFVSPKEVEVGTRRLRAKDIVIATGSRTSVPPVPGLAETGFIDHASFLEGNVFPKRLVVLGGGYIGIEFAQIFHRFGTEVVVVEMGPEIIVREDHDVIAAVRAALTAEGIKIRTGWTVKEVRQGKDGEKIVRIEDSTGQVEMLETDEVFVASGRRGNIEELNLEAAGVKLNRTYVAVDAYLQTNVASIWACGDVHGALQFTHVAAYEAVKLVRNILFPMRSAVDYSNIPWALYTDPEVGHIGLTENEAREIHGDSTKVYKVPMNDVDRAVVDRASAGFVKLIGDAKGNILGGHVVGTHASTLIEEIVLAKKKGVKIGELAQLTSPYPSLADAVQKSAALYYQNLSSSWIGGIARKVASWSQ